MYHRLLIYDVKWTTEIHGMGYFNISEHRTFLPCAFPWHPFLEALVPQNKRASHWHLLRSAASVVRSLVENLQVANKNHMLFIDCFCNSVVLCHLLKNELGVLVVGTIIPSRKQYTKELGKRLTTWPEQASGGQACTVDSATAYARLHQVNELPFLHNFAWMFCSRVLLPLVAGTWQQWTRTTICMPEQRHFHYHHLAGFKWSLYLSRVQHVHLHGLLHTPLSCGPPLLHLPHIRRWTLPAAHWKLWHSSPQP